MKKIFFACALVCISLFSNAQRDESLIQAFLNSTDYIGIQNFISPFGAVSVGESNVKYYEQDYSKPTLNIVIRNNASLTGIIEVLPIPARFDNVLPNNSHYAMQFVDYSNYNVLTKSGVIRTIDLNYDQYTSATLDVAQTSITRFTANTMPQEIKLKYSSLKKIGELNRGRSNTERAPHYCDLNGNGNVSFGECIGCMQSACNGSPTCSTMCWIVNVAGIGTSVGGQCTISMGAACIILSIMY